MIRNPIFPGFNPDPCICRKGEDYYVAVSSFEWFPGIPVYHSKDMKNWELYTHVLTDDVQVDLKKLPSAKGVWAPSLTYSEKEDLFYVVYGAMNSMNARYFDIDNYLITARDIQGPWSEPVYLHSSGFDASILHDDDGRKWVVALEWETREGYEKPGAICLVEYSPEKREIVGYPKRIWSGGTDRGCIEAPHLTKRGEYYYIMCAEGGTGYGHSVTMGRAKNVWGPYEGDPMNPIVTSVPGDFYERHDPDHLKPKYFNPESVLQKSGHGSYVETSLGEVYLVHLCARPFVPELRCTLGRETAIQKMNWTDDGWLRMEDGTNLAKEYVPESQLTEHPVMEIPGYDDFDSPELGIQYYAPRMMPQSFTDLKTRPGHARIRGQESRTSLNRVSILARKLTSFYATVTTKMEFLPEVPQHSAGVILYYDNMNYINLRKYSSETLGQSALSIIHLDNGEKTELLSTRVPVKDVPVYLRLNIVGRETWFEWSYDGEVFEAIGDKFDTTKFSDEYSNYGEFTGCFVGITCADRVKHQHYADFDFFEYLANDFN
ncbi:glycoside hydrolase family 43 protein [Paenibacillus sp. FSL R10-2782]|uniref:glycoside hydrolase family 43 protein n=1 Tax=Paenibacillus sp. FSL R10-2782 TaxID=2954661 RepID=UPI00315895A7